MNARVNVSELPADQYRQREQSRWLDSKLNCVRGLRDSLEKQHVKAVKNESRIAANKGVLGQVDALRNRGLLFSGGVTFDFGLSLDADDHEIREFCEAKALQCDRVLNGSRESALLIAEVLERCRIDSDLVINKKTGAVRPSGWQPRVSCGKWWRRKMRVVCARAAESVARDNGLTQRLAGCYVSEFTFRRWMSQQNRNKLLLDEMVATNEDGESFSISELAALGQSNPELRRNELMVRLRGFEEWAEADSRDWQAVFYTVTCPSKYHKFSGSRDNGKFNQSTPKQSNDYLQRVWSRIRSKYGREGIECFGFRIAEPHHDGCSHWHLLLFVERHSRSSLTGIFRRYALQEDGEESGAIKHRFTAEIIDPEKGSAVGYVSKYISKNVDGFAVGVDLESGDFSESSALRVRAWASVWGIRQFQQIGGPAVTVYRELRRAANNPDKVYSTDQLEMLLEPADAGDWSKFTESMGGAVCPRKDRPASVLYSSKDEKSNAENRGRYGELVRRVLGVVGDDFLVVTRWRKWVVEFKSKVSVLAFGGSRDLYQKKRPLAENFKMSPRFKYADGVFWSDILGASKMRPLDSCQ